MDLNDAIRKLNAIKETTKACKGKIELIGLDDNSVTLKFIIPRPRKGNLL